MFHFTPFPGLVTERLVLRKYRMEDAEQLLRLKPGMKTVDEARGFLERIGKAIEQDESIFWVAAIDDVLVGTVCLWNLERKERKGEIGYELLPEHQGKGLMQEAVAAVLAYGFREMGLEVIEGVTEATNGPSIRLLERAGFERVGVFSENEVLYRMTGLNR
ncbi:hypothetical protein CBW65_03025 [Tumebacillus avium]|uniref:N-acetyltransferase domain-containing protein n=1 Tax=Tumebacillus avium TaxID=1903704 RepID=A0A1Y0IL13_9BACL|nr:GNAT family N-acetyltransferase [Tumebacillus avium]ARU60143.1 hypothetical protein CBW65_03025 [Tumebacillus avium]